MDVRQNEHCLPGKGDPLSGSGPRSHEEHQPPTESFYVHGPQVFSGGKAQRVNFAIKLNLRDTTSGHRAKK